MKKSIIWISLAALALAFAPAAQARPHGGPGPHHGPPPPPPHHFHHHMPPPPPPPPPPPRWHYCPPPPPPPPAVVYTAPGVVYETYTPAVRFCIW